MQICPKLSYFIHEYACLLPERSAISEKLAKNTYASGAPLHRRKLLHRPKYLRSSSYLRFAENLLFHWRICMFKAWYASQLWEISKLLRQWAHCSTDMRSTGVALHRACGRFWLKFVMYNFKNDVLIRSYACGGAVRACGTGRYIRPCKFVNEISNMRNIGDIYVCGAP